MKANETYKILNRIRAVYKSSFSSYSQKEFDSLTETWVSVLSKVETEKAERAVDAYIESEATFPPKPGQILAIIRKNERRAFIDAQTQKLMQEKPILSESTKQLLSDLGKDETALDTEFDLLCREAYLRGLKKQN